MWVAFWPCHPVNPAEQAAARTLIYINDLDYNVIFWNGKVTHYAKLQTLKATSDKSRIKVILDEKFLPFYDVYNVIEFDIEISYAVIVTKCECIVH
jgi:hypothetical protein